MPLWKRIHISGSFGGINLEDIAAPRCFEIERKLKERCDIPIFHDDQHGTAIITLAGLTNALKVVGKEKEHVKIVISGAGAAAGFHHQAPAFRRIPAYCHVRSEGGHL